MCSMLHMVTKKHQNVKRFCKKRFFACTRRFLLPAALRQRDLKGDDAAFVASADAPVMAGHDGLGGGQSDAAPAGRAGTSSKPGRSPPTAFISARDAAVMWQI